MAPSAPSLLEYARYHGLAADHLALDLNLNLSAIFDTVQADAPDFCSFIAPPVSLPREGKLRLKKSELQLLAASLQPPPPPSWDEILPDPHRIRNLKLEIPLLQADNEADLQNFSGGPSLDLKDLGVFPDCTDSPSKLFDLASNWDAKLSQEKLQATKEDLMYLQHALQDPYTEEGYQQVLKDALPSYTHRPFLDEEETELQQDKHLQDPHTECTQISPPATDMLYSPNQGFSATRSLLGFMSTRGDISTKLKSASQHFSKVKGGEGRTP